MKLAEALTERKALNTKIGELRTRLEQNALVQEGDKPSEDPQELMTELNQNVEAFVSIVSRINRTNERTMVDGRPLGELVTERDARMRQAGILRSFLDQVSGRVDRYSRKEIKILPTVDVITQQKILDAMQKRVRELDTLVQSANWTTDLLD